MTYWCVSDPVLQTFSGRAPLFPLPNVLFPGASIPLHIFEPRYRKMTADALEGERLIALGLPPAATNPAGNVQATPPSMIGLIGLGRIIAHERLEDGRYLLVLRGVARTRLVREEVLDLPYRVGQLEICTDLVPSTSDFDRRTRAEEITSLFCSLFPGVEFQRLVQQAMTEDLPLGSICDIIASALPVPAGLTQFLLDELNSDLRSQMLWQLLKSMEPHQSVSAKAVKFREFPPGFSLN